MTISGIEKREDPLNDIFTTTSGALRPAGLKVGTNGRMILGGIPAFEIHLGHPM
jgi:hypothetical protein